MAWGARRGGPLHAWRCVEAGRGLGFPVDRAVAWVPYLPIPGLGILAARLRPADRLVRYHARQGGGLVLVLYVLVTAVGLAAKAWPALPAGATAAMGAVLLAYGIAALLSGGVAAARGRYLRVRPVWDALAR